MKEQEYHVYVDAVAVVKTPTVIEYIVMASSEHEAIEKAEIGDFDMQIISPLGKISLDDCEIIEENFETAVAQAEQEQLEIPFYGTDDNDDMDNLTELSDLDESDESDESYGSDDFNNPDEFDDTTDWDWGEK